MTALIDIVFLLLIYFLLTTNYLTSDIFPLELPMAETAAPQHSGEMIIALDSAGAIHLDGTIVSDEELSQRLQGKLQQSGLRSVLIRSDSSVELAKVVTVLDIARACGAEQISLATVRRKTGP